MTELAYRKRQRSVKRDDYSETAQGGIVNILIPYIAGGLSTLLPPDLPIATSSYGLHSRDAILVQTPRAEAMWGSAIGIAITKMASLAWDVKSEVAVRSKRAQELLLHADGGAGGGGGWVSFLSKHIRAYTCTGNGAFIEIERETNSYGSRIRAIHHLSSSRCIRTGDIERPVIYRDRMGREHELRWWQVMMFADMPDEDEDMFGAGLCAAERAYSQIVKLAVIERYVYEKVSGNRALAIHIVNGISAQQMQDALSSADDAQMQKGAVLYKGGIVIPALKVDADLAVVTIPLAELPDGFNAEDERNRADLIFANAIGLDPQELKPISNQQMGAGAQSSILNEKAKGRGLVSWKQDFIHNINEMALDDKTTFYFTERDYADQLKDADVSKARADFVTGLIKEGVLTAAQGLQLLVDKDELPKEFLPQDMTPEDTLSDSEKPEDNARLAEETPEVAASLPPDVAPITQKAKRLPDVDTLLDDVLADAVSLAERVTQLRIQGL